MTLLVILAITFIQGMEACEIYELGLEIIQTIGRYIWAVKNAVFGWLVKPNGPATYNNPCKTSILPDDSKYFCSDP